MSLNNKQHGEMIERYHQGQLSDKEMNRLERQAQEDPFLSDALEGLELLDSSLPTDYLNDQIDKIKIAPDSKGFYRSFITPMVILSVVAVTLNLQLSDHAETNHIIGIEENNDSEKTVVHTLESKESIEKVLITAKVLPKKDWIQNIPAPIPEESIEKEIIADPIFIEPTSMQKIDSTKETPPAAIQAIKSNKHPVYYLSNLKVANYKNYRSREMQSDKFNNSISAQFENKESSPFELEKEERILYTDYLEKCMKDFSRGKFKIAIRGFNHILRNYPNDANALFYSGLSHYNLGLEKKSVALLRQSGNHEFGVFISESEWYLSLALLKSGNESESRLLMEKIKMQNGFYAERAGKMLKSFN